MCVPPSPLTSSQLNIAVRFGSSTLLTSLYRDGERFNRQTRTMLTCSIGVLYFVYLFGKTLMMR